MRTEWIQQSRLLPLPAIVAVVAAKVAWMAAVCAVAGVAGVWAYSPVAAVAFAMAVAFAAATGAAAVAAVVVDVRDDLARVAANVEESEFCLPAAALHFPSLGCAAGAAPGELPRR